MNAKEIGRRAGRVFNFCLPDNWCLRSQEDQEDYGIDAEIEIITPQDKATGFIFKAQIKGQKEVKFIEEGKSISFSISLERLHYYMSNADITVILFVVDITKEIVYWHSLQNDDKLRERMQEALLKKQEFITIHLEPSNILTRSNVEELGEAINGNLNWLRLNALRKINFSDIFKKSADEKVQDWLEHAKDQSFYAYMEKFDRLYLIKNYKELLDLIHKVFPSKTEKKELRFYAALYAEKVCEQDLGVTSDEYFRYSFDIYQQLLSLVRSYKFDKYYQIYILLLWRSWILRQQIQVDYHHFMSFKMIENDPIAAWALRFSRSELSLKLSLNLFD